VEAVREEVHILSHCYNSTLGMSFMAPAAGIRLDADPWLARCRDPHAMYLALHHCAVKHRYNASHPWFYRFTNRRSGDLEGGRGILPLYEGLVLRGMYADQILNLLCAGFRPDQIMVVTSCETGGGGEYCFNPPDTPPKPS
jgi:hypothetical protein